MSFLPRENKNLKRKKPPHLPKTETKRNALKQLALAVLSVSAESCLNRREYSAYYRFSIEHTSPQYE